MKKSVSFSDIRIRFTVSEFLSEHGYVAFRDILNILRPDVLEQWNIHVISEKLNMRLY